VVEEGNVYLLPRTRLGRDKWVFSEAWEAGVEGGTVNTECTCFLIGLKYLESKVYPGSACTVLCDGGSFAR
jgi:hypothetical protein